jgi:Fur family ferric uptake transcriptional regulator
MLATDLIAARTEPKCRSSTALCYAFMVMTISTLPSVPTQSRNALPTAEAVATLLSTHGYRVTNPRRAVIAEILRQARPFSAEQMVARLKETAPEVGRATVYRTLEILASVDVVSRLLQADGHPAYIVGTPGHRHHLVCSDCGSVVAFSRCPVDDLVRDLSRDTDFAIHAHTLEVFGTCPACQDGQVS